MSENSPKCVNCLNPFEIRNKGYKRYNVLNTNFKGKKLADYLDDYKIPYSLSVPQFLCHSCYTLLTKTVIERTSEKEFLSRSKNAKRKIEDRTPIKTPRRSKRQMVDVGVSPFSPLKKNKTVKKITNWKSKAIAAIQKSRYLSAFRLLLRSPIARKIFQKLVKLEVRREAAVYSCGDRQISKDVSQKSLDEFSWPVIIKDLRDNMPSLYSALAGAITSRTNELSKLRITLDDKFGPSIPQLGTAFGILMYTRHPRKFNFLQELNALQMWSSGSSQKLFQCFQHMAISKGIKGAVSSVDRLRREFDTEIKNWKKEIEGNLEAEQALRPPARIQLFQDPDTDFDDDDADMAIMPLDSLDDTLPYMEDDMDNQDRDEPPTPPSEIIKHPGFCVVWDNVQVMSTVRHQTSDKQNKMLMWALSYAALNRFGFRSLEGSNTVRAQAMPLFHFLPNQDDYDNLKVRMEVMVMRILKKYLAVFKEMEVIEHIPHDYSEDSCKKSKIINLGVMDENPSSTAGVIAIMDHLHRYVPNNNGNLFTIPCHGDGLSVERMRDAKAARSASLTKEGRLEGLEPVPQEFHKRCILLQDTVDEFYSGCSAADRGTLFHIRNLYNHRNVTKCVNSSFNPLVDLLGFTTDGLATLLAMKLCGMSKPGDIPSDFPSTVEDRDEFLLKLAKKVVETVWCQVDMEAINEVLDAPEDEDDDEIYYEYCICKNDTGDYMVKCSNTLCYRGSWFHITCIGLNQEEIPDDDWWCSDICKDTARSQYCVCHTYRPELQTVRCSRGSSCVGGKLFHLECIGIRRKPGSRWKCGSCSVKKTDATAQKDHVYLYTCALLWKGLQDLSYKDAVRENDGEIMITHWRIDMIQFWQNHHNKYLILGHKLLADVQGWQPARLRNEIIWNRTANIKGGAGHNIELDLVNEFLNCDFKEHLKAGRGQYSEKNVERTSQFIGSLSRDLDKVFQKQVSGTWVKAQSGGRKDYSGDVYKFVEEFKADDLFEIIPGREHTAFPGFSHDMKIKLPGKLKARLKKYSKKLDISREILPN